MKKITKAFKPQEERSIFTEGINYFDLNNESVWGPGDPDTIKFLKKAKIAGRWLNLAAGDGRYNLDLLKKADTVVASDIDRGALSKLWHLTPKEFRSKLKIKAFNILDKFPFRDKTFDGVFCTGTLHYFSSTILKSILSEIDRVLKPDGQIISDFATDIKRILPDGRLYIKKGTPQYKLAQTKTLIKNLFRNYNVQIIESEIPKEIVNKPDLSYKFSCKFLLISATKK